jgi:uncharacterized protein YodC (DUF2158 family)
MAFNIGDVVAIKSALPNYPLGTIVEVFSSHRTKELLYKIHIEGEESPREHLFDEDSLIPYENPKCTYDFEIQQLDSLVVAVMYKVCGNDREEIARGHGHIIHDAEKGIAQATSYALKKIYEKINGGEI